MNRVRKLLVDAAGYLELPANILAGVPKMELTGFQEFSIESHKGLVEYEKKQIGIETDLGKVWIVGNDLTIKLMNRQRLTIKGDLYAVHMGDTICE